LYVDKEKSLGWSCCHNAQVAYDNGGPWAPRGYEHQIGSWERGNLAPRIWGTRTVSSARPTVSQAQLIIDI
jgi:hypothetical protein